MSKKLKFIWIDDNLSRRNSAKNLARRLNVSVKFVSSMQENLEQSILSGNKPDLILIDHNLGNTSSGIYKKGSTMAALIREKWSDCPILCITGQDANRVDSQKRNQYEDVLDISKISSYDNTILSIAKSYKKLRENKPQSLHRILSLLFAPKDEYERLKAIIPVDLKSKFSDAGLLFNLSNWIRKILLERPGFLYDKLWTATLLGIKESSFSKVEEMFNSAKYKGIFSNKSKERWWKSNVISILNNQVQDIGLPWEKGRKLNGIEKKDYSKCYATGEDLPEVVAFIDEGMDAGQAPMKLQETIAHRGFENLLFFDEIRLMKSPE